LVARTFLVTGGGSRWIGGGGGELEPGLAPKKRGWKGEGLEENCTY